MSDTTTFATLQTILDKIKSYDRIIVSRHIRPDGDAIGSTKGFTRMLRLTFPDKDIHLVAEDKSDYLAFLGDDEPQLPDEMYENAAMHNENGAWQMIFGVNTLPEYRRHGYAGTLLRRTIDDAKQQGRKGLVLTCKERLIPYYAKFGFKDEGMSDKSTHGNVVWHQMRLVF